MGAAALCCAGDGGSLGGDGLGVPPGSLWGQLVGSAAVKKGRLDLAHWVDQRGDEQG